MRAVSNERVEKEGIIAPCGNYNYTITTPKKVKHPLNIQTMWFLNGFWTTENNFFILYVLCMLTAFEFIQISRVGHIAF